jgi:RimJ/RimL family protein N-acetyltransferase
MVTVTPPEELIGKRVVLRRTTVDHADGISVAARHSLEHLAPWMPWAHADRVSPVAQRERIAAMRWEPAADFDYTMFEPDDRGAVIGACGLMRRHGPGTLEIGYWVHVDHVRRGVATEAAALLTEAGLAVEPTVVIRCDEANVASAAVPRKLGYRLVSVDDDEVAAPACTGRSMRWEITRSAE